MKAAVVGLGVGEQHARALAAHRRARDSVAGAARRVDTVAGAEQRVELACIADLDRARADKLAAELGTRVAADFDAIVADRAIDLVVLASYDDQHAAQVVAALRAGKHVFCEKPLCRTPDEVRAIAAARGDRHLACNLILRAAPLFVWLREAIRAGELGDIYAIDGDYLYGRIHKITEGWRGKVEAYSVFQGGAVHLVDLVMWLLGERPARVSAVGNKIVTRDSQFRYADFVAATYELPSGIVARITANFGCVSTHQHVLRVFGTKATFIADDAGARLHVARDPADAPGPYASAPRPHATAPAGTPPRVLDYAPKAANKADLLPPFVDAILAGADPAPAARHELDVITACIAADRALAAQQSLSIEYP